MPSFPDFDAVVVFWGGKSVLKCVCLLENVYYHYFGLKGAVNYTKSSTFH